MMMGKSEVRKKGDDWKEGELLDKKHLINYGKADVKLKTGKLPTYT